MSNRFNWPVRVYYEDTDAGGIVYHARYLYFLERARTEWLRHLGFNQSQLKQQGVLFVVRDMEIKWCSSALLDQALDVSVSVRKIKKASMLMTQTITLGEIEKVRASVTVACLNSATMRPIAIPEIILSAMNRADGQGVERE
ncbi:MAG: tol-pal system-associated acyl-CoA thioesterase [Bermanella sp.]|jgi:tol-pal system-associated acyl-CoA thioesterase